MSIIEDIRGQVDAWASEVIGTRVAPSIREAKVIRDPIHDFVRLFPHEVAILDCPVLQRLRRIRQNALTYLVYPGMHHTRFEHSLGVLHVAELMLAALRELYPDEVTAEVRARVRLAALLHDVGHTFLSHLGETLLDEEYGNLFHDLGEETVDGVPRLLADVDTAEILSYLIITSTPFKEYFHQALTRNPGVPGVSLDGIEPTQLARLVIGKVENPADQFMADIIHGAMDADKIDYFMRDCHYSGIRAEVDASRLINTLRILSYPDWPRSLTVSGTALHHLEQILITKLILSTSVYHHHKVRATEAAVRRIFRRLRDRAAMLRHKPLKFMEFTDFLRVDDNQFFVWAAQEEGLEELVEQVTKRELLKRSLVLCRQSVHPRSRAAFLKFAVPAETTPESVRAIEQAIYDTIPASDKVGRDFLVLDFPPPPETDREGAQVFIQVSEISTPEALKDLLPTDDWLRTYTANKYRAHVFYIADEEKRLAAARAADSVLRDQGIQVTPLAYTLAHLVPT